MYTITYVQYFYLYLLFLVLKHITIKHEIAKYCINRVNNTFAQQSLSYGIQTMIKEMNINITDKIYTYSLKSFSKYTKKKKLLPKCLYQDKLLHMSKLYLLSMEMYMFMTIC